MVTYVLKLNNGKYYVGRTNNILTRFEQHKNGFGSTWTKIYRPISIIHTYEDDNPFYEDMIVKVMMHRHGIDNVRGGAYSQVHLSIAQIRLLRTEIYGATDRCFKCGGGHFVKDCSIPDGDYLNNIADFGSRVLASGYRKASRAIGYISSYFG